MDRHDNGSNSIVCDTMSGMCLKGTWYRLTVLPEVVPVDDPVESLDVQILYNRLLKPVLGIGDPREDDRIK